MWTSQSSAQEMDILNNDLVTDEITESADEAPTNASSQKSSEEINEEGKSSWFGFMSKPLLNWFAKDEDATQTETDTGETMLDKSIRLADEGNLEEQMNLAYMYLYGTNGVKQDYQKAFHYYSLAAQQEDPIATNNLGSLYFNGIGTEKDTKKALLLFERASDLGNDNASLNLGFIFLTGGAKDPSLHTKAIELFQKSADAGNKIAKFMVGYAYYVGFIVPQNYSKAFPLIRSAAEKKTELDEAQLVLADMYIKGVGVTQNYDSAMTILRQAALQGNLDAVIQLARHYTSGDICDKNLIMAHTLYNIAAANGYPNVNETRDAIGGKLKIDALTVAQKNAQEFVAKPSELTSYIRQTYGNNLRYYIDRNMN